MDVGEGARKPFDRETFFKKDDCTCLVCSMFLMLQWLMQHFLNLHFQCVEQMFMLF